MTFRQDRSKVLGQNNNNSQPSMPNAKPSSSNKNIQIKCYNCCQPGHLAKNCKSDPVCGFCKLKGHSYRDCRKRQKKLENQQSTPTTPSSTNRPPCKYCKKTNHMAADCFFKNEHENKSQSINNNNSKPNNRNNDKDTNHNNRSNDKNNNNNNINNNNANKPSTIQFSQCRYCKKTNHTEDNCFFKHKNTKPDNKQTKRKFCKYCKKNNHKEEDCWFRNKQDDHTNTTCRKCGQKGHVAKDCKEIKTNEAKPWPPKRVCTPEFSQLDNKWKWSPESIASWTEFIRMHEYEHLYKLQIESLKIDLENPIKITRTFNHHFNGTQESFEITNTEQELKKIKKDKFIEGHKIIQKELDKHKQDFLEQTKKLIENMYENKEETNLLSVLPTRMAEEIKALSMKENQNKELHLTLIKEIATYVNSKLLQVEKHFEDRYIEDLEKIQTNFALKKSRKEAQELAKQAQNKYDKDLKEVLSIITDSTNTAVPPQSPTGHIPRRVAARHNNTAPQATY